MKIFIPSICALALLSGCAETEYRTAELGYSPRNRFVWASRCRTPEPVDITYQSALIRHRAGANIDRQAAAYEAQSYAGPATTQLTPSGTTIFGATPGAASSTSATIAEIGAPPATYLQGPNRLPTQYSTESTYRRSPEVVAERKPVKTLAPVASPVPGRPGYVVSPFSPKSGYIDVSGLAPGSDAKDPYTGKVFRVP